MDRGTRKSEPESAPQSPITFRPCSNGEYCPPPETELDRRAEARFREIVDAEARRRGMSRREVVQSALGTAAALTVLNQVYGCGGDDVYQVPDDECELLAGDELIFDIQVHPPSPLNPWRPAPLPTGAENLIRTLFVGSDTSVACISGVPAARSLGEENVLANMELQELVGGIAGPRLLLHANVDPTLGPGELDYMADIASHHRIAAWKVYPHVGSWRLDRDVGLGFIERAREIGIKLIAAHRGIGPGVDYDAPSSPVDLVEAAAMFPDVQFLTYHAGWDPEASEDHPFDPEDENPVGIDRLIKAVRDAGMPPNVYAELGSTWRNLMTQPLGAAHAICKLLLTLGEDRVVWGTDSVFTGSPQEQIVAFRAFQIPEALREEHGYPEITDAIRRKIFGLNAAAVYGVDPDAMRCAIQDDDLARLRAAHREDPRAAPAPAERSYGPRTRREFLAFLRWEQANARR